jgi:hypothetical protein
MKNHFEAFVLVCIVQPAILLVAVIVIVSAIIESIGSLL